MMFCSRLTLACALVASAATAQISITTTWGGPMHISTPGSVFYFDVDVATDITLQSLDVHLRNGNAGANIDIWTIPGSWVGNENSAAGWTQVAANAAIPAPNSSQSTVVLPAPIPLLAGSYGLMIQYNGDGQSFTDGLFPLYRSYVQNAHIEIFEGAAHTAPFTGISHAPRVCNLRLEYTLGANVVQADADPLGVGCDGMVMQANGVPSIGNNAFGLQISGVPSISPFAFYVFGTTVLPAGIDLTTIGMGGCFGYTSSDLGLFGPEPAFLGQSALSVPIPSSPNLSGVVLGCQGTAFSVLTPLGLAASNGMELTIGI